jgi:hypothetical protein
VWANLANELRGRFLASAASHKNIESVPILVNGAPEVVQLAIDHEEDFIQMPCIAGSGTPTPALIGIGLPELQAPLTNGFIRDEGPTGQEQLFHFPVAEAEPT